MSRGWSIHTAHYSTSSAPQLQQVVHLTIRQIHNQREHGDVVRACAEKGRPSMPHDAAVRLTFPPAAACRYNAAGSSVVHPVMHVWSANKHYTQAMHRHQSMPCHRYIPLILHTCPLRQHSAHQTLWQLVHTCWAHQRHVQAICMLPMHNVVGPVVVGQANPKHLIKQTIDTGHAIMNKSDSAAAMQCHKQPTSLPVLHLLLIVLKS